MSYSTEIENILKINILDKQDIFDYRGGPLETNFNEFYEFCRESLDIHSKNNIIDPNIFLYTNSFEVNAKAGFKKGHSIILINMGLMNNCIVNYLNNEKLEHFVSVRMPALVEKLDISIRNLAYQVTTQFTYYHELAHLFQISKNKLEIEFQERKIDDKYDIIKHKLEINADTYSSISIASHLDQYVVKIFGKETAIANVTDVIKVIGAVLLHYIINFSDKTTIYIKEYSHPHPFLRMVNIILNITNHIQKMPSFAIKGINLEAKSQFKYIIDFYQELEENGVFQTKFSDLVYQNKYLQEDIINYFLELINLDNFDYEDAMDVWNKHIK